MFLPVTPQELHIAAAAAAAAAVVGVILGVLVGSPFLKCPPIGSTAAGPHPHWWLEATSLALSGEFLYLKLPCTDFLMNKRFIANRESGRVEER